MTLQDFHAKHLTIVENLYASAAAREEHDFDAYPTLMLAHGDVVSVAVLHGEGSPLDAAADLIKKLPTQPDMVSFMSPIWRKVPETLERSGEGVMVVTESVLERAVALFELTREPFALKETPAAEAVVSRVNLLYQPTPTTEH